MQREWNRLQTHSLRRVRSPLPDYFRPYCTPCKARSRSFLYTSLRAELLLEEKNIYDLAESKLETSYQSPAEDLQQVCGRRKYPLWTTIPISALMSPLFQICLIRYSSIPCTQLVIMTVIHTHLMLHAEPKKSLTYESHTS